VLVSIAPIAWKASKKAGSKAELLAAN
jgi:hypothetical protein